MGLRDLPRRRGKDSARTYVSDIAGSRERTTKLPGKEPKQGIYTAQPVADSIPDIVYTEEKRETPTLRRLQTCEQRNKEKQVLVTTYRRAHRSTLES